MSVPVPLFAAGLDDAIAFILVILFVVIPFIAKIINVLSTAGNMAKRPPQAPAAPPKPRVPPKAANPELNSEVEEFLRRAAERRSAEQRRAAAGSAAATKTPPAPPRRLSETAKKTPPKPPRKQQSLRPLQAEVLDDVHRGEDVAEHVAKHFKSHAVLERPASAAAVDQADEAMEQHIHAAFDHRVGSLGRSAEQTSPSNAAKVTPQREQTSVYAGDIIGLLRNPESVRMAIVLNEILTPPEHRW